MPWSVRWRAPLLALAALALLESAHASDLLVGAMRWDNWTPDSLQAAIVLDQTHAADRTPFFAHRRRDGSGDILLGSLPFTLDAEAQYAFAAGLDYWIFGYYVETGTYGRSAVELSKINRALRAFVSLPDRRGIRFALQLNQNSPRSDFPVFVDEIARLVVDRDYLRGEDRAAPVFIYDIRGWEKSLGEPQAVKRLFAELAEAVRARTGVELAYVLTGAPRETRAHYIEPGARFRGFTFYANAPPNNGRGYSTTECSAMGLRAWREAEETGQPFLPTLTFGWDPRPITFYPGGERMTPGWCAPAARADVAARVRDAVAAASLRPPPGLFKGIVIYAWNELIEGGWLVPTRRDGQAHLSALAAALGRDRVRAKTTLRFPLGEDRWPCPLNMTVERDEIVTPRAEEAAAEPGPWVERECGTLR